jgi:hypothetical protein
MWANRRGIAELDMFAERLPRWQQKPLHFSRPAYRESYEQPLPGNAQALCFRLFHRSAFPLPNRTAS